MSVFEYIGPYDEHFKEEYYTIEYAHPAYDAIKFVELPYPLTCNFFLANFNEVTKESVFHKKLTNVLS